MYEYKDWSVLLMHWLQMLMARSNKKQTIALSSKSKYSLTEFLLCFIGQLPDSVTDTRFVSLQVTIVIKYFFQFGFLDLDYYNSVEKSKPYYPHNIIGVEKKDNYFHCDLIQLLTLFFHRSILKVSENTEYFDNFHLNMCIIVNDKKNYIIHFYNCQQFPLNPKITKKHGTL